MSFRDYNMSESVTPSDYFVNSNTVDQPLIRNAPQLSTITSIVRNATLPATATQTGYSNLLESLIVPLYGTIFLLSVVGNSLVLITLARNKRMRTITNVYLLNLAVSDLLLGVFCMPFTLLGQILKNFVFGITMCKLIPYFQGRRKCREDWPTVGTERAYNLFLDGTLLLVPLIVMSLAYSLIAVKLWRGLRQEMRQSSTCQQRLERTESSGRLGNSTHDKDDRGVGSTVALNTCHVSSRLRRGFSSSPHRCFQPILPGPPSRVRLPRTRVSRILGGKCQGSDFFHESRIQDRSNGSICTSGDTKDFTSEEQQNSSCPFNRQHVIRSNYMGKSIEAKKKVIRMLFVIVLEFFVCWAPLHVINTWYLFAPELVYSIVGSTGISLVQLLAYISSCCNPITYCFMNKKFRQAFLNLFDCHRCWRVGCRNSDIAMTSSRNAAQAGNNSELSGNESTVYLGKASLVTRSEVVRLLEKEDRV
ncbi:cholecystokinin receptor type A isoform X2 [Xylocopa sonorina]|uniref:cholecystokinin receptor type A isoform X2 n=1 Tax=Xylocopa sonorina TaxID=1818115 RepID=UPI00403A9C76